jgi:hypothetical protein
MTNFVGIPMKRQMIITQTNNIRRSPFNELIKDNRPMLSHFLQKKEKREREKREREKEERERGKKKRRRKAREREKRELPRFQLLPLSIAAEKRVLARNLPLSIRILFLHW